MDVLLTTMLLAHGRHRNFILIIKKEKIIRTELHNVWIVSM